MNKKMIVFLFIQSIFLENKQSNVRTDTYNENIHLQNQISKTKLFNSKTLELFSKKPKQNINLYPLETTNLFSSTDLAEHQEFKIFGLNYTKFSVFFIRFSLIITLTVIVLLSIFVFCHGDDNIQHPDITLTQDFPSNDKSPLITTENCL